MSKWRVLVLIVMAPLVVALAAAWIFDDDEFSPPRLAGPPLVLAAEGRVLLLTTHREETAFLANLLSGAPREKTHVDLWAFSSADLSPVWVRRVASRPYHARDAEPRLLGADGDSAWVIAGGVTQAVVLADGVAREARSAPPAANLRAPMVARHAYQGDRYGRARGVEMGAAWHGVARAEEVSGLARDPFRVPDGFGRYRLYGARVEDRFDTVFRRQIKDYRDFAPAAAGREYLNAGLLVHGGTGRSEVVVARAPTRLFVLHELREGALMMRGLANVLVDGTPRWDVGLGVTAVLGVAPLLEGPDSGQALILFGILRQANEGDSDVAEAILRVGLADGARRVVNVGEIDGRALKRELAR